MFARALGLLSLCWSLCAAAADWPGFQGNPAHTGYVAETLNPSQFAFKWQIAAGNGQPLNPVAAASGRVFVSTIGYFNDPGLYVYDAGTGAALWHVNFGSVFSVNPPALADGRVYLQTGNHGTDTYLRAYDAATGQLAFQAPHEAQWERYYAPTIMGDEVFINGGYYGGMYAFGASDGTRKWFRGLAQYDQWTPAVDDTYAYAYVGGELSVVERSTGLVAYSILDPNFEWNGWSMHLAPVLGGKHDVIAIHDGRLIRFDLDTRSIAWELARSFAGQPSVAKGVIYALDAGALSARDQQTGNLLWTFGLPSETLAGPMIVTDSHVFVSSATKVHAVNLVSHADDWSYPVAGQLALAGKTLYIAGSDGKLTAIRLGPAGAYADAATAYRSTPLDVDVLANDEGFVAPISVQIVAAPEHGSAVVTGSPGGANGVRVKYTPDVGYLGSDSFQYRATSGALSSVAAVQLSVVEPISRPDTALTHIGTPVEIDVLENDEGFSDPVTVTVGTPPLHGSAIVVNSPGDGASVRIVYTPAAGYAGEDSFEYELSNGINAATAAVAVNVLAFKATDDQVTVLSNFSTDLRVAVNDVGFQDPVSLSLTSGPGQGYAYVSSSPGNRNAVALSYTATSGSYTTALNYQLSDGVHTDIGRVTINVVPYIAQDDAAVVGSGNTVGIHVTDNDLGFGYPRAVELFTIPTHGAAQVLNSEGYCCGPVTINYTASAGFVGDDSFQYVIDDGVRSAIATVKVHVITDVDNDIVDDAVDNCLGVANASQLDADGDGYGNWCDGDFNADKLVTVADLAFLRSVFATSNAKADLDGNGLVSVPDLARFKVLFGRPPGPSALHP